MTIKRFKPASCTCGLRFNCFCPELRISTEIETDSMKYKKLEALKQKFGIRPDGRIEVKNLEIKVLEDMGFNCYTWTGRRVFPEAVAFINGLWTEDGRYGGESFETTCNIFLDPPVMRGLTFTKAVLEDGEEFRRAIWAN